MTSLKTPKQIFFEDFWGRIAAGEESHTPWVAMNSDNAAGFISFLKRVKAAGPVLDLGCGMGRETLQFARAGFDSYGIDFAEPAIRTAQEYLAGHEEVLRDRVQYVVGNALELPYDDAFFEAINDGGCLGHISPENRERYLATLCRVLKPGGYLRVRAMAGASGHVITSIGFPLGFTRLQLLRLFQERFDLRYIVTKRMKARVMLDAAFQRKMQRPVTR